MKKILKVSDPLIFTIGGLRLAWANLILYLGLIFIAVASSCSVRQDSGAEHLGSLNERDCFPTPDRY